MLILLYLERGNNREDVVLWDREEEFEDRHTLVLNFADRSANQEPQKAQNEYKRQGKDRGSDFL